MTTPANDLATRLRLIAAWHKRGGPTPKVKCPNIYTTIAEAVETLEITRNLLLAHAGEQSMAGEAFKVLDAAQGTSAFGQDAQRLEAKPAGPVAEGHAPNHDITRKETGSGQ